MSCIRTLGPRNIICHPCVLYSIVRRSQLKSYAMGFIYSVNLILIFVTNILYFFSGICLNSLVIVSFWRSVQLRKKLCYFAIMVLSCCDLLVVLTNHPLAALVAMLWLTGKITSCPRWLFITLRFSFLFIVFSFLALLVMNFDRYLSTHYPVFHRTSMTRRKFLSLLATLLIAVLAVTLVSQKNEFLVSHSDGLLICFIFLFPPTLLINYKLFTVARKMQGNNTVSAEMKFSLRNISSCLLAVVSFVVLSIPVFVYIGLRKSSGDTESTLDGAHLASLWAKTISSMNSTFNCLIFYWKNTILRTEGMKVIKSIKVRRRRTRSESNDRHLVTEETTIGT